MSELDEAFAAESLADNAPSSEPAVVPEIADAPETLETVEETDEQKNERVAQEAVTRAEKKAKGVQRRFDELTAEKYAANKRLDEAIEMNKQLLARLDGPKTADKPTSEPGAPVREQYPDDASFWVAQLQHETMQKAIAAVNGVVEKNQQLTLEQQRQAQLLQHESKITSDFVAREKVFAGKMPDYAETMAEADISIPNSVGKLLRVMSDGPDIAYQMAKNPQLVDQFLTSSPEMHGILLGQISATLKASPSISKAAPPGKPVRGTPISGGEPTEANFWEWSAKNLKT